jgi:Protein of unknown function with PCYCGC motif
MKNRVLFVMIGLLALVAGALVLTRRGDDPSMSSAGRPVASAPVASTSESAHKHAATGARVPAYQNASQVRQLPPTLPPAGFIGKTREAYKVAKEIPQTLAQLPCYCECDRAFGHKSLHSCFEDEHASSCAVCVDEALLAYKLEKSGKTASQIREQIIAQYSMTPH